MNCVIVAGNKLISIYSQQMERKGVSICLDEELRRGIESHISANIHKRVINLNLFSEINTKRNENIFVSKQLEEIFNLKELKLTFH